MVIAFSTPKIYADPSLVLAPESFFGTLEIDERGFAISSNNGSYGGVIPPSLSTIHDVFGDGCVFLNINFLDGRIFASDVASSSEWIATASFASPIPEPSSLALILLGVLSVTTARRVAKWRTK